MKVFWLLPNLGFSAWPDAKTLQKENIDTLITVCKKAPTSEIQAAVPSAYHLPLTDGKQIPEGLEEVLDLVLFEYQNNRRILVNCYLGRNRSCLVAALAYQRITGNQDGFAKVKELRPSAFYNEKFQEILT